TAHESVFNTNDGSYRSPNSQQGYSPFTTWTRGLAWAILGYAEQLEFLNHSGVKIGGLDSSRATFVKAAVATANFYIANCCTDGIPMWDSGAPDLNRMGSYLSRESDPYNRYEPVDSSAAAIAAQGLLRLGNELIERGERKRGTDYRAAAFTIAQ